MEQHEQNQKEVVFVKLQRSVQVAWRADLEEGRADHSGHQSVRGGALLSFEQSSDPQRDTVRCPQCAVPKEVPGQGLCVNAGKTVLL